ncbi:MAG: maleylpyruvate isomerase family mycothiol-dependent enzyme [Actinomycetota bacterium]|nr:maleylpyruvate isomerase family mycothiol-dependent enzyme [Actinomycetota bacterium]
MSNPSPWPLIHAERKALLDDLQAIPDQRWDTPSLCQQWTVRQVLGHMTATAKMTPPRFIGHFVASGFRFDTMVNKDLTKEIAGTPADLLARFAEQLNATGHPPGPVEAMLGEAIIHSEDIRRPLGIKHTYPTEALIRVADFFKGSNLLIGAKKRIAGLGLHATDADWSSGSGPEVSGPLLSLVLAITGRIAALDDLYGAGMARLRSRD